MDNKIIIKNQISNSKYTSEVCLPSIFLLQQFENIADFVTGEPLNIRLKIKEDDFSRLFEQVLRIRVWIPNQSTEAWLIFSEDRQWRQCDENIGGLIIRHVVWDKQYDINRAKGITKIENTECGNEWPYIKCRNIYLYPDKAALLINQILKQMDMVLEKGIELSKRYSHDGFCWNDVEVMRLFDWGQVKTTWSPPVESKEIEGFIFGFGQILEQHFMSIDKELVFSMELDYSCHPQIMKDMMQGIKHI